MDFTKLNITQIRQGLLDKKFTAVEIVQFFIERIKKIDPQIKAFITITDKIERITLLSCSETL